MRMLKDFKEFALRGNVVDLAVAVIIGGAFGAIVTSLVEDLITPVILNPALKAAGAENIEKLAWNGILYGKFLAAVLKFIVIAFVLFLLIRLANKFKKQEEAAPAEPSSTDKLLAEIRDELKKRP